jgi:hypothetical protein
MALRVEFYIIWKNFLRFIIYPPVTVSSERIRVTKGDPQK